MIAYLYLLVAVVNATQCLMITGQLYNNKFPVVTSMGRGATVAVLVLSALTCFLMFVAADGYVVKS